MWGYKPAPTTRSTIMSSNEDMLDPNPPGILKNSSIGDFTTGNVSVLSKSSSDNLARSQHYPPETTGGDFNGSSNLPAPTPRTCPCCGRCPHCGHPPYQPPYPPIPPFWYPPNYIGDPAPWTRPTITFSHGGY